MSIFGFASVYAVGVFLECCWSVFGQSKAKRSKFLTFFLANYWRIVQIVDKLLINCFETLQFGNIYALFMVTCVSQKIVKRQEQILWTTILCAAYLSAASARCRIEAHAIGDNGDILWPAGHPNTWIHCKYANQQNNEEKDVCHYTFSCLLATSTHDGHKRCKSIPSWALTNASTSLLGGMPVKSVTRWG